MLTITQDDHLGLNDHQLAIVQAAIDLTPLPVDERIADRVYPASDTNQPGAIRTRCFSGERISRLTAYRFHRADLLNEHLFHAWPAAGYDYPALTSVIFERPEMVILGADLLPIADVVFDRTYYGRWMLGYADLLAEHWPGLIAHRLGPEPAPDPYFTNQIGSTTSVLIYLAPEALESSIAFLTALTEHWITLHDRAEPRTDDDADDVERRRIQLMTKAYKALDYHSPASDSLAAVMGWPGANLQFDAVFGPDEVDQGLDAKRTYLDVALSPGTSVVGRTRS
jgi:hypothetical protein